MEMTPINESMINDVHFCEQINKSMINERRTRRNKKSIDWVDDKVTTIMKLFGVGDESKRFVQKSVWNLSEHELYEAIVNSRKEGVKNKFRYFVKICANNMKKIDQKRRGEVK